ncbi:MAG: N-6 DNA methylase [Candidatus Aenigmatarchaeota archaeon]
MSAEIERRTYGAHLTSIEIFEKFILPRIKDKIGQFSWVDLFAGEGNLILPILKHIPLNKRVDFFKERIFLFDILEEMVNKSIMNAEKYGIPKSIAEKNIIVRDTIKDYPEFITKLKYPPFHVTNPPYLYLGYIRKHKETQKYLKYFKGWNEGYQDLYQLALINDLRHGIKNMIYIIPSNFLFGFSVSNKIREDFFPYYTIKEAIIFEKKIFEFTGTNVMICFFERKAFPSHEPITFKAIKINSGVKEKEYVLKPNLKYRAGGEFEEFVNKYRAEKPINVKYYLMKNDVESNKGDVELTVIDSNSYINGKYEIKKIRVNKELYNKIKRNPLFVRTLDTGSYGGRAGIYFIKDEFGVDGILVTKSPYRTHPIQIFLKPELVKEDLVLLKDTFNMVLEYFREITDSEFMTTYKYSNAEYTRKYLGLSQVKKLLETIPILSLTFDEKRKLMKLIEKGDKKGVVEFIMRKNSSCYKGLDKFF